MRPEVKIDKSGPHPRMLLKGIRPLSEESISGFFGVNRTGAPVLSATVDSTDPRNATIVFHGDMGKESLDHLACVAYGCMVMGDLGDEARRVADCFFEAKERFKGEQDDNVGHPRRGPTAF